MRLLTKIGVSTATSAAALALPLGTATAQAHTVNTAILGVAINGGHNSGILGVACGRGAVNTALLGTAITNRHCPLVP